MQPIGVVVVILIALSFVALVILGIRTENRKKPEVARAYDWTPRSEFASHREWLGGLNIVKAQDAQFERMCNEIRRHCRIGKIILK